MFLKFTPTIVCHFRYVISILFSHLFIIESNCQKLELIAGLNHHSYYNKIDYDDYTFKESRQGRLGYNVGIGLELNKLKNAGRPLPLRFILQIQNCRVKSEYEISRKLFPTSYINTEINKTILGLSFYFFNLKIKRWPELNLGVQYSRLLIESSKGIKYINSTVTEYKVHSSKNDLGLTGRLGYEIVLIKKWRFIPQYNINIVLRDKSIRHSLNLGMGLNSSKSLAE